MTDAAARLEVDEVAWEAFLAASAAPCHLQSSAWAAVKRPNGWSSFRVAADPDGGLVGAQVLVQRPRGLPWGLGYLARGPVTADGTLSRAQVLAVTRRLREAGRRHRLATIVMEPEADAGDGRLARELIRAGWRRTDHVQPDRTRIIDLAQDEPAILAGMHRKTRQSVSKSERLGVCVVAGDAARIGELHAIHAEALQRAGIAPRSEEAFREMWTHLAPRGKAHLLFAEAVDTGEAVAAVLLVGCGRRVADLYGGTTEKGARRRANYLLKWEALRRMKAAGYTQYDLWGLPREGIEQFKSGFGGHEVDYVGAWRLTLAPVGSRVLGLGATARDRYRRWRYRDVHRPGDPHGRSAATAEGVPTGDPDDPEPT